MVDISTTTDIGFTHLFIELNFECLLRGKHYYSRLFLAFIFFKKKGFLPLFSFQSEMQINIKFK